MKKIEPKYNKACESLYHGKPTEESVSVISGFVSFVVGCSPTAMRLGSTSLINLTHAEAELLDKIGELDRAPPELGSKTLTDLLKNGSAKININQKYPQSMGINSFLEVASCFSSSHWEILVNPRFEKFPFLTSDYPAAIEKTVDPRVVSRLVPLRPDLAVRIYPQIRPSMRPYFPTDFRYRIKKISPSEVTSANRTIIRSSENLVFSPIIGPWIRRMISQNSRYRIELEHTKSPHGTGFLLTNQITLKEHSV